MTAPLPDNTTPLLVEKKRRRPFPLLAPLVVLAIVLLYDLAFTPNFFQIRTQYHRVNIQFKADTGIRGIPRPTAQPVRTAKAGDIATLAKSDINILQDPDVLQKKMIEIIQSNAEGDLHGYIPSDASFEFRPQQPYFYGSLIDVLKEGSSTMLLALGMTLVIATGGIDLSVGATIAIAGAIAASLLKPGATVFDHWLRVAGSDPAHPEFIIPSTFIILGLPLLAGLLAGAWNGLLVSVFNIQPIIATLIFMISGRGIASLVTGEFQPTYDETPGIDFVGQGSFLRMPFPIWIVLLFVILTLLLTRVTALGLFIESIGNNPGAARVAGIHSQFVKFLAYTFLGLCASVAGLIHVSDIRGSNPLKDGQYSELDAIVAVALGGTSLVGGRFSLVGSLLGVLIMQTLTTTILSTRWLPSEFTLVVKAFVVLLVCLLQSEFFRADLRRPFSRFRQLFPRRSLP